MYSFKNLALAVAKRSGAVAAARFLSRNRIRILAYHGVGPANDPLLNFDGLQVATDAFRAHLEVLARSYRVRPLADVVADLAGRQPLEPCTVAITFDDGYRNNLDVAAPILKEFGFHATFFITTGFIDRTDRPWWYSVRRAIAKTAVGVMRSPSGLELPLASPRQKVDAMLRCEAELRNTDSSTRDAAVAGILAACGGGGDDDPYPFLDWEGVRKIQQMGFEIGAHTVSHVSLAHEGAETVRAELKGAVDRIERMTDVRPRYCSYPYGLVDAGSDLERFLDSIGIRACVTTTEGMTRPGDNLFRLKRLNVAGHDPAAFESLASGLTALAKGQLLRCSAHQPGTKNH